MSSAAVKEIIEEKMTMLKKLGIDPKDVGPVGTSGKLVHMPSLRKKERRDVEVAKRQWVERGRKFLED